MKLKDGVYLFANGNRLAYFSKNKTGVLILSDSTLSVNLSASECRKEIGSNKVTEFAPASEVFNRLIVFEEGWFMACSTHILN